MGVCASPDGVALPVGPTVPVPTAYFPLTNGSTYSWPIPEYWAYNTSAVASKQTKFVKDSYFGTVVECNATAGALPTRHLSLASRIRCSTCSSVDLCPSLYAAAVNLDRRKKGSGCRQR